MAGTSSPTALTNSVHQTTLRHTPAAARAFLTAANKRCNERAAGDAGGSEHSRMCHAPTNPQLEQVPVSLLLLCELNPSQEHEVFAQLVSFQCACSREVEASGLEC